MTEKVPSNIESAERAIQAADKILKLLGSKRPLDVSDPQSPEAFESALVSISESEFTSIPAKALPTISVTKAIGDFADSAQWSYELSYGMQGDASRHVLIDKGHKPQLVTAYPYRPISDEEAKAIADDLSRLASADISD